MVESMNKDKPETTTPEDEVKTEVDAFPIDENPETTSIENQKEKLTDQEVLRNTTEELNTTKTDVDREHLKQDIFIPPSTISPEKMKIEEVKLEIDNIVNTHLNNFTIERQKQTGGIALTKEEEAYLKRFNVLASYIKKEENHKERIAALKQETSDLKSKKKRIEEEIKEINKNTRSKKKYHSALIKQNKGLFKNFKVSNEIAKEESYKKSLQCAIDLNDKGYYFPGEILQVSPLFGSVVKGYVENPNNFAYTVGGVPVQNAPGADNYVREACSPITPNAARLSDLTKMTPVQAQNFMNFAGAGAAILTAYAAIKYVFFNKEGNFFERALKLGGGIFAINAVSQMASGKGILDLVKGLYTGKMTFSELFSWGKSEETKNGQQLYTGPVQAMQVLSHTMPTEKLQTAFDPKEGEIKKINCDSLLEYYEDELKKTTNPEERKKIEENIAVISSLKKDKKVQGRLVSMYNTMGITGESDPKDIEKKQGLMGKNVDAYNKLIKDKYKRVEGKKDEDIYAYIATLKENITDSDIKKMLSTGLLEAIKEEAEEKSAYYEKITTLDISDEEKKELNKICLGLENSPGLEKFDLVVEGDNLKISSYKETLEVNWKNKTIAGLEDNSKLIKIGSVAELVQIASMINGFKRKYFHLVKDEENSKDAFEITKKQVIGVNTWMDTIVFNRHGNKSINIEGIPTPFDEKLFPSLKDRNIRNFFVEYLNREYIAYNKLKK